MKNLTRTSPFGWKKQNKSPKINTLISTRAWPTIGKIILLSNNSQLKEDYNSNLSFLYQNVPPSICSKPRRRRTISNFMSEESLLWMIANNSFQNILDSLEVLSILKIYLLISQESIFNITKFWKSSRRILLKNVLNYLKKLDKMLKISRNSTSNSAKISNLVSTKILTTEISSANS